MSATASALTVSRGYVLVMASGKVSAVCSGPEAKRLQRRFGGRIVNARGLAFRYGQQRQVRIVIDAAEAAARPTAKVA